MMLTSGPEMGTRIFGVGELVQGVGVRGLGKEVVQDLQPFINGGLRIYQTTAKLEDVKKSTLRREISFISPLKR